MHTVNIFKRNRLVHIAGNIVTANTFHQQIHSNSRRLVWNNLIYKGKGTFPAEVLQPQHAAETRCPLL